MGNPVNNFDGSFETETRTFETLREKLNLLYEYVFKLMPALENVISKYTMQSVLPMCWNQFIIYFLDLITIYL